MRSPSVQPAVVLRPAADVDRGAIWALIDDDVSRTSRAEPLAYFLRLAFEGRSDETRVIVAESDGTLVGFALFGEVAGTIGTGRIHFVAVTDNGRRNAIGSNLCDAAVVALASRGARLVVAEIPDDEVSVAGRALLTRCGFVEAGRVAAYY